MKTILVNQNDSCNLFLNLTQLGREEIEGDNGIQPVGVAVHFENSEERNP